MPLAQRAIMTTEPRKRRRAAAHMTKVAAEVFLVHLILANASVGATKHHYIHWNASNPIFRIDNTDHIIDVNAGNLPHEFDQANFICPKYHGGTASKGDQEQYVIYNVSKEEYESCRIMSRNPKIAAVCNKPTDVLYFTITFRSFSPTPGGMEFKPGQDYYFISTSADGDLWRKNGGKCASHNMRLVFKVADNQPESNIEVVDDTYVSDGDAFPGDYFYPSQEEAENEMESNAVDSPYPERDERDYRHNPAGGERGLIKQEASRMQHSSSPSASSASSLGGKWRFWAVVLGLSSSLLPFLCRPR